jgi:hypothetical protein
MRIGELVIVSIVDTKYKYVFPKRVGNLDEVPVYPVTALSEDGIIKPFISQPLPTIKVGSVVMYLGTWEESSKSGLSRILYGDKMYGILSECIAQLESENKDEK